MVNDNAIMIMMAMAITLTMAIIIIIKVIHSYCADSLITLTIPRNSLD